MRHRSGANLAAGAVCLSGCVGARAGTHLICEMAAGGRCASPPRGGCKRPPYSATGQHFNRHHLPLSHPRCRSAGAWCFPAGRRGTGGSDSAAVGVGQRGVGGSAPGVRTLRCWAGRRRCTAAAQCSACWGCRSGRRCSSSPGQRSVRRCCSPAACCILCFCRAFYGSACGFAGGCGGVQHAFCPDRTTFASAARRCGGGVCLSLRSPLQGLAKPL